MKRRSRKYWENRQKEIIDNAMDKKVALSAKELSRIYAKSLIYLNSKAKGIFDKYSSRFGLSELQARKLLNMSDSDLQRMLLMIQNSGDVNVMELRKILETPAYRTRIRRLEEQLKLIDDYMNKMQVEELNIHKSNYTSIANDTYYQAMYNIQKGVGYRFSFTGISEDTIDHILNTNWSGKSYSARIWENTDTLASKVKEELIIGLLTGRTEREMSQIISNQFQVGYSKARRLISTESCYVYNGAIMESYKESGIDEYVFMAVHDNKTSKICRKLDRKVFKVSEKVVGVNCPPMHPWCRSVTGPKVDDDIEFKRRAYNPQTGDYDVVSEKESYDEWYERINASPFSYDYMKEVAIINNPKDNKRVKTHLIDEEYNIYSQTYRKDAQNLYNELRKMLPEFISRYSTLNNIYIFKYKTLQAYAGYEQATNSLYIAETMHKYGSEIINNDFPSKSLKDLLVHEFSHKKHWDAVKKYHIANNDKYDTIEAAKRALEKELRSYVSQQQYYNPLYLKKMVSENANHDFLKKGSLNETIADVCVLIEQNEITDNQLVNLVGGVLNYDG